MSCSYAATHYNKLFLQRGLGQPYAMTPLHPTDVKKTESGSMAARHSMLSAMSPLTICLLSQQPLGGRPRPPP